MSTYNTCTMDFQSETSLTRIENFNSKMVDRLCTNEIKPFIFSNSLKSWPALNLWDPQFFKENYGDIECNVNPNLPDKAAPYLYNAKSYDTLMKLSDLIELMSKNKNCYLAQQGMQTFKNLKEDYDFHDLVPSNNHKHGFIVNLWMGANTRSGLHFDKNDNFLAQIYGFKKVFLISSNDASFLHIIRSNFYKSPINPMEPNFNKFSKFRKARVFEGELKPGDVLFIPKGWYHYIYSPNQSISLNCWYGLPITSKELFLVFYRSGWQVWLTTIKDFIWYGVLSRPYEIKLFAGPPTGKVLYNSIKVKVKRLFWKVTKS